MDNLVNVDKSHQPIIHLFYMDTLATIVIPCAPYHETLVERAIASAQAQTVPCGIMPYFDHDGRGAGYARNQGAHGTETPFLVFLDADDELSPTFIEECLAVYEKGSYIYTAWNLGNGEVRFPDAEYPLLEGRYFHHPTTLFPTRAFHALGGFNEDLPGDEDFDFYMRALLHGMCPRYLNKPLFTYHKDGQRSQQYLARPDFSSIHWKIYDQYGGQRTAMADCAKCGGSAPVSTLNDCREGDIRAIALWTGIRNEASADGTRVYRGGNWQELCVAPADVETFPDKFKKVFNVADLTPEKSDVLKDAGLI